MQSGCKRVRPIHLKALEGRLFPELALEAMVACSGRRFFRHEVTVAGFAFELSNL